MKPFMQLAWRNIWRKPRWSALVLLSVAFALVISVSLRSLMLGNYDKMNEAATKQVGHVQVHARGFWADKSINDLLADTPVLRQKLQRVPEVEQVFVRLQNGALASGEKTTKAVTVIGIEAGAEEGFTHLGGRLIWGQFLTNRANAVLLAEGLARFLKLDVGDTLVLIGQGYHASVAAGKYPIAGILKLGNPQANLSSVYMPLNLAQSFYSADGLASAYVLTLADADQLDAVSHRLTATLGPTVEVLTWAQMLPEVKNSQRIDTTVFTLLSSCLYLIIGMGLIGTVLMMTLERRREFGILRALGMQKAQLQALVSVEALLLGGLGILLGLAIAIPFVLYMNAHPIPLTGDSGKSFEAMGVEPVLQLGVKPYLFALLSAIVLGIMALATLVPMGFINRLQTADAIK